MRLLFLSNLYPPADRGGWEQWCQEVADALTKREHDVWVLTSNYRLDLVKEPEARVKRELYLESDLEHYRPLDFLLRRGRLDRHNANVVRQTISEIDPDAIVIWGMWQLDPRLAILAETMRPDRVAYYFCGYWPIDPDPHSSFWQLPETNALVAALKKPVAQLAMAKQQSRVAEQPAFQHSAFVSNAVRNILSDAGVAFSHTRVICGGINLTEFRRARRDRPGRKHQICILYAGSLSRAKGVDTLLRATVQLAKQYKPGRFHLSLAGNGHPAFELWAKNYVEKMGLGAYVTFLGRIEHSSMADLLKEFDVLAFPSTWQEPMARVMMEGLAAGLALVSTTTGGSGEVLVDGVNSLTFEAGNASELARQIGRLLDEDGLMQRLTIGGTATADERFDFQRMVDELEAFLSELHVR